MNFKKTISQALLNKKIQLFILIVFIILLSIPRFTGLTTSPPGFYKDEAGIAINGYTILKTARDEYGRFLPLFFENFGDFKEPIFIYSQIPALLIWGQGILATRITSALWGVATIILFAYFLKVRLNRFWLTLAGVFIIGTLPWLFHFSRIGFQLITLPLFTTVFLIYLDKLFSTYRYTYLYICSAILGLMFYTYYAGRFVGLLFFGLIYYLLRKNFKSKYFVTAFIIYLLILLPALIWSEFYPETLLSRFNQVSIINLDQPISEKITTYIIGYLSHYSLDFWFFKGDHNLRHSTQYHYPLFWAYIPLALTGIYTLVLRRKSIFNKFLILTILTFPIASAITKDAPHIHRVIHMIPIISYVLVIGLDKTWTWLKKKRPLQKYTIITIFIIVLSFEIISSYLYYYSDYSYRAQKAFHFQDINALKAFKNYPSPQFITNEITEYRASTYQLINKLSAETIQSKKWPAEFIKYNDKTEFKSGYYLLENPQCQDFKIKFPQAELKETINKYCIYYFDNSQLLDQ